MWINITHLIRAYFMFLSSKPSRTISQINTDICSIHTKGLCCRTCVYFQSSSLSHTLPADPRHLQLWHKHIPGVIPTGQVQCWQIHSSPGMPSGNPPGVPLSFHMFWRLRCPKHGCHPDPVTPPPDTLGQPADTQVETGEFIFVSRVVESWN